jgi:hypothetical protein
VAALRDGLPQRQLTIRNYPRGFTMTLSRVLLEF